MRAVTTAAVLNATGGVPTRHLFDAALLWQVVPAVQGQRAQREEHGAEDHEQQGESYGPPRRVCAEGAPGVRNRVSCRVPHAWTAQQRRW